MKINNPTEKEKSTWKKAPWLALIIFLLIIFIFAGTIGGIQLAYAAKIYPGVTIGAIALGGETKITAAQILREYANQYDRDGLTFQYNDKTAKIDTTAELGNPDASHALLSFDVEKTVADAFAVGREHNSWQNIKNQIKTLIAGERIRPSYYLDQNKILKKLQESFEDKITPARSPSFSITKKTTGETTAAYEITVNPGNNGLNLDYDQAMKGLNNNLRELKNPLIELTAVTDDIFVPTSLAENMIPEIKEILALAPIDLSFGGQKWTIDDTTISAWLKPELLNGQPTLRLNKDVITEYLTQKISPQIDIKAQNARLKIINGKVSEFRSEQTGQKLNIDETINNIQTALVENRNNKTELAVEITEPQVKTEDLNDLGIKEIIGVGKSNFAGSPVNRRKNIATGATTLNGVIIQPDEEFHLVETLGAIDGDHGYLPELVIRDNKTTPEYGGGLCQIGTTMFRAALSTGLPITERYPHSYRVQYYEPAGMDATIYDPQPDVRFINDTGNPILIQTKIQGDNLIFEFWGRKDGRTMVYHGQTDSSDLYAITPRIWGITPPPAQKDIETLDLKPGEKKCTERAHNGATAEFNYEVTYPNGDKKSQIFHSVYKPWQAVCLLGVEKLSEPLPDQSNDSTAPTGEQTSVENSNTNTNLNSNTNTPTTN